ncbi:MAG: fibronectin type III domain-containing [Geobacteraceae bacterium]|nr:MAG: fibronectin type III domain-containing [Geobacteraceae bacterium]
MKYRLMMWMILCVVVFNPTFARAGIVKTTGSMNFGREAHTATLLSSGKVLIAGGADNTASLSSSELYDPNSGTFTSTGSMATARYGHSATLLNNGKVLITGGVVGVINSITINTTELYDPVTGTFTSTGNLSVPRVNHQATLLQNGKVLISGGADYNYTNSVFHNTAEIYDPVTGQFTPVGNMTVARRLHTATLLQNGNVLIAGGTDGHNVWASSEIFDTSSNTFSVTGSLGTARHNATATLLPSGKIMIAGGTSMSNSLSSVELYDPITSTFTFKGNLSNALQAHTATLLNTGQLLFTGGMTTYVPPLYQKTMELYTDSTGVFSFEGNMGNERYGHTATLLQNGSVLIVGGYYHDYTANADKVQNSAELYTNNTGLVAYWSFDNSNANDSSGNGNHGIPTANVTFVQGKSGNAAKFGGYFNPGHIRIPNSQSLQFDKELTISLWARLDDRSGMDAWGNYSSQGAFALFAKSHDQSGYIAHVGMYNIDSIYTWLGNNIFGSPVFVMSGGINRYAVGDWVHIAYVVASNQGTLYMNGNEITRTAITTDFSIANGRDLYLGKYSDSWYPLNGALDEVRIYNRALTASELQNLYSGNNGSTVSGTVTSSGTGLAGVSITLSGPTSQTATTASDGTYSFTGLTDGTYIITPRVEGYTFNPPSREVTVSGINISDLNFAASLQVTQIPKGTIVGKDRLSIFTVSEKGQLLKSDLTPMVTGDNYFNPEKSTIVIVHGWNPGSLENIELPKDLGKYTITMAKWLKEDGRANVYIWEWLKNATSWIPPGPWKIEYEADVLAEQLSIIFNTYGYNGKIHLIGHSAGAALANAAAEKIKQKSGIEVDLLTTLDAYGITFYAFKKYLETHNLGYLSLASFLDNVITKKKVRFSDDYWNIVGLGTSTTRALSSLFQGIQAGIIDQSMCSFMLNEKVGDTAYFMQENTTELQKMISKLPEILGESILNLMKSAENSLELLNIADDISGVLTEEFVKSIKSAPTFAQQQSILDISNTAAATVINHKTSELLTAIDSLESAEKALSQLGELLGQYVIETGKVVFQTVIDRLTHKAPVNWYMSSIVDQLHVVQVDDNSVVRTITGSSYPELHQYGFYFSPIFGESHVRPNPWDFDILRGCAGYYDLAGTTGIVRDIGVQVDAAIQASKEYIERVEDKAKEIEQKIEVKAADLMNTIDGWVTDTSDKVKHYFQDGIGWLAAITGSPVLFAKDYSVPADASYLGFSFKVDQADKGDTIEVFVNNQLVYYKFADQYLGQGILFSDFIDISRWSGKHIHLIFRINSSEGAPLEMKLYDISFTNVGSIQNITAEDGDNDGLPDVWERLYWKDISNSGDSDFDSDGLSNAEEYAKGTDPTKIDTDGDGYSDFYEIKAGLNPLDKFSMPLPTWNDITVQTTVTKSGTLYDRINNCYYVLLKVTNPAAAALNGPLRMVITNPSIPLKTNLSMGLKPDGYKAAGEPYFVIRKEGEALAAGASLSNLRVNFEMLRVPLTYGMRIEQFGVK